MTPVESPPEPSSWIPIQELSSGQAIHWRLAAGLCHEAMHSPHAAGLVRDLRVRQGDEDGPRVRIDSDDAATTECAQVFAWGALLLRLISGKPETLELSSHPFEHQEDIQLFVDAIPNHAEDASHNDEHVDTLLEQHPELRALFDSSVGANELSDRAFVDFLCDMVAFDERVRPSLADVISTLAQHADPDWATRLLDGDSTPLPPEEVLENLEGTLIADRYQLTTFVGTGPGGELYRAEQVTLGREIWVQIARHAVSSVDAQRSFVRAASTLARINEARVIDIFDVASFDGSPFVAAECVKGNTLAAYMASPVDRIDALNIAMQMCDAVRAIHAVNRPVGSLSPEDFMLRQGTDGRLHVKLTSLGGLFQVGEDVHERCERYAAPETRYAPAGPESDVYALSAIILRLLEGHDCHQEPKGTLPEDDRSLTDELSRNVHPWPSERPHTASSIKNLLQTEHAVLTSLAEEAMRTLTPELDDPEEPPETVNPPAAPKPTQDPVPDSTSLLPWVALAVSVVAALLALW